MGRKDQSGLTISNKDIKKIDEIMKLEDLETRPQTIRRLMKFYHKHKARCQ